MARGWRLELSGCLGSFRWVPLAKTQAHLDEWTWVCTLEDGHPGTKGPKFSPSEDVSSAVTWYNGSALTFPQRSRLRLLLSFSLHEGQGQKGCLSLVVKVHNLCRVKTKYLAVSSVTDNFEQLIKDSTETPNIPISKLKLDGWTREDEIMVFMPYLSGFEESVFKRVGKIGFMQISLELHQPNMHIGYRVIPLSVHHSVTCQTPF